MNIHISKEEHEFLLEYKNTEFVFGSYLYGTNAKNSDKDILITYNIPDGWETWMLPFPNVHQFQYKDIENNIDYIWISNEQFFKNQASGESTINSDIILFADFLEESSKLNMCRTYNVMKAYLGFAKRDLKQWKEGHHKLQHANRGLITVYKLYADQIPTKADIKSSYDIPYTIYVKDFIEKEIKRMRDLINKDFEEDKIKLFPQIFVKDPLLQKLLNSNNIKEFKY